MAGDVDRDYKMMLSATEAYNKDAGFIDNLVTDFSATAEELLASIQNMIKAINEVTSATNEGANGTATIAQRTTLVVQKSGDVIKEAVGAKDSAEKLVDIVSKFKV